MSNIVTSTNASYNTSHVVSSLTTRKFKDGEFRRLKARQHAQAERIIIENNYKPGIALLLHELVNLTNSYGKGNPTQERLAAKLRVSTKTIQRYISRLEKDKVIFTKGRSRKSNTYYLLFIQHELHNRRDNLSSNLTPLPKEEEGDRSLDAPVIPPDPDPDQNLCPIRVAEGWKLIEKLCPGFKRAKQ